MIEESKNLKLKLEDNREFVGIETTAENFQKVDEAFGNLKDNVENFDPGYIKKPVPLSKGGTGQTTVQGIREVLGLGRTAYELPIENGGTGATTAAGALENLNILKQTESFTGDKYVTLNADIVNLVIFASATSSQNVQGVWYVSSTSSGINTFAIKESTKITVSDTANTADGKKRLKINQADSNKHALDIIILRGSITIE